jgi:hypothetical protein
MKTKLAFVSVLSAAALAGCASDKLGDGGPDDPPIDDPQDPPVDPPRVLDASGTYRIHSKFDLAQNMPGTVGSAVNGLIGMTDDPNDPSSWILQQLIGQLEDGFFKDLLTASEPFVAGELNAQLIEFAPGLVNGLLDVGQLVGDIAKNFGLGETLKINQLDGQYAGTLTIDTLELTIDSQPHELKFVDYDLETINATSLPVTLDATKKLSIGRHQFPIPYGTVLRIGLDEVIIPAIDPGSNNLGELLNELVNCQAVGQQVADALGFGGSAIYAGACVLGLDAAADAMYEQIAGIDSSALDFDISGISRTVDADADYDIDRLEEGTWTGTLSYGGTAAPLGPATYHGTRLELQ